MATFGGGEGTPIDTPVSVFQPGFARPETYLSLEEYAHFLGISETALFGFVCDADPTMGCSDFIWDETSRFQMIKAIQQAEKALATHLKHPLKPTYFCDEYYKFRHCELQLRRGKVISVGAKVLETVFLGKSTEIVSVDDEDQEFVLDSATIQVSVDFTDCRELVVFYPGQTRWEIHPSEITIEGGIATIVIPKARLLKPELLRDYTDVSERPNCVTPSVFLDTVDIYHRFPDAAQAVTFVWKRINCGCSTPFCSHTAINPGEVVTQTGAMLITDARLGMVKVEPATWNTETGVFNSVTWSECRAPDWVLVNYVAGINDDCDGVCPPDLDAELVRAIIALAHSNLPTGLCGCARATLYYEMDSKVPTPDEGPTIFSPFGITRGQNLAWQILKRNSLGWGGMFG